jgi:hypothetical protein
MVGGIPAHDSPSSMPSMESLQLKPKVLILVFLSVAILADLVPAANLGPGLLVSTYNWVSSKLQSLDNPSPSAPEIRANQMLQNHSE